MQLPTLSLPTANTGLSHQDIQSIVAVVRSFKQVQQLVLFGSRAKGNYKPGSDIDLAVKSQGGNYDLAVTLADELNQATRMPYFFDVVDYQAITEAQLLAHIDRVGLVLFDANQNIEPMNSISA